MTNTKHSKLSHSIKVIFLTKNLNQLEKNFPILEDLEVSVYTGGDI